MAVETIGPVVDQTTGLVPSSWKFTSHDRRSCSLVDLGGTVLTSGTVRASSVSLPSGFTVAKLGWVSGATALATGSNQWACLLDSSFTVLAVSADGTSAAWAANTLKTFTMAASYKTIKPGTYWVCVMVNATTTPSLQGTVDANSVIPLLSPVVTGSSSTGQTTPPALAAVLTSPGGAAAAVNKPFVLIG